MPEPRGTRPNVIIAGALVLALLLGVGWLAAEYWVAQSENEVLRTQADLSDVALKTTQAELDAEHILATRLAAGAAPRTDWSQLRVAPLGPYTPGAVAAVATVVWDSRDARAVFTASGLPANAAGEHYALWLMGPKPERVVTFTVRGTATVRLEFQAPALPSDARFAVGVEKAPPAREAAAPGRLLLTSR